MKISAAAPAMATAIRIQSRVRINFKRLLGKGGWSVNFAQVCGEVAP
jgi:hypothetical protein